jgi:hypothetical protein
LQNRSNEYKDIYATLYSRKIIREMPYFRVEQLIALSFSGNLSYSLPESVKTMLVELESCLEITDAAATTEAPENHRKEYKSDTRRFHSSTAPQDSGTKYRNRYDLNPVVQPFGRGGGDRDKDKRKRDFKKDGSREDLVSVAATASDVDKEWEMMRAFKATKIESKTGIEKTVNDLRIALNKISAANYEKQRDVIMALVNGYFDAKEDITAANTRRISKSIFDIASSNKFYSEMYAKLYKELADSHTVFRDLLEDLVDGFVALDSIPVYIDPDSDYDGFCAYSKACDIRKSTSTFIVNCFKLYLVPSSRIADILSEFVKYVDAKRSEAEYSKCVEEVVENIYIIATLCSVELKPDVKWHKSILPRIKQIVAERNNGLPGMSNRAAFKLLDLLEKI